MTTDPEDIDMGSGAGSSLPAVVLVLAAMCTVFAVFVSAMSIHLQLKNYRKPVLQRMVVRIMVMVPIYAVSSLIALFSLEAAFVIDVVRDIYEAFVIYCFFSLLLSYLGGERSLLILLHGRPPKLPAFPVSIFQSEVDVSDPHTFLFLKRGILQYVQVKPVLAILTLFLKAIGKYKEGDFSPNSGYLYVTIVYNFSICLSLYCLGMFWLCINSELKSFRPIPKFLCVKGILFFSFWQSLAISILVAAGVITKLGPYTDSEHISLGLTDTLICIEMPFFAIAHMYAFSHTDYIDPRLSFVARMPMYYAFRDAFGFKDVVEDSKATLRGEGMDYREFEPAEGYMHQGVGRDRRIRAGLRYSKGGKRKYWLPKPTQGLQIPRWVGRGDNRWDVEGHVADVHAPLTSTNVVTSRVEVEDQDIFDDISGGVGFELPFGDLDDADEELFQQSRKYLFGDYNYPCIDVSTESARTTMWDEEERVLRDERGAFFSPIRGAKGRIALDRRDGPAWEGYGAVGTHPRNPDGRKGKKSGNTNLVDVPGSDGRSGEYTVDFEQDRTPPVNTSDVRLKWTKVPRQGSLSSSHHRSSSLRGKDAEPLVSPVSSSPSAGSSSNPQKGRTQSPALPALRPSRTNSRSRPISTLPPDAVDLVVDVDDGRAFEDSGARKSESPSVRGLAGNKMYRHKFVSPSADVSSEGVDADRTESTRIGVGDDMGKDTEVVVVSTPTEQEASPSSQPDTYHPRSSSEENPWA